MHPAQLPAGTALLLKTCAMNEIYNGWRKTLPTGNPVGQTRRTKETIPLPFPCQRRLPHLLKPLHTYADRCFCWLTRRLPGIFK